MSSTRRTFAATALVLLLADGVFGAPSPHTAVNEPVVIRPPGVAWSLPATLVIPEASAPVPCIVFFAGSGPTDRDWLSPMLPGKNGSARQLAEAFAGKSVGSLRFDKVGSGTNQGPLDVLSLAHYADEASVAFDFLAARPECGKVFLLGHSEGSLHMTSAAVARQDSARFGGLISMAGPSRSMLETAIEQIRNAHRKAGDDMPAVETELAAFREAMRKLPDAQPPAMAHVPEARVLWTQATDPRQAKVVRELLLADPLEPARAYHGRALVLSAARDGQVPPADGDRLFDALGSKPGTKSRRVIADANHVFKRETRDPGSLTPVQIASTYAHDGHPLADGTVESIVTFVQTSHD